MRRLHDLRTRLWLDRGSADATALVAGMGRSGTTWVAQLINHDCRWRILFEPFFPARVPEAAPFAYIQYLKPDDRDAARVDAADRILAGRLRNAAVDVDGCAFVYRRRLVKDIRCNLMLRWLAGLRPSMPIILVVRHPLAVAASWLRLGWGTVPGENRTDFEVIAAQPRLFEDFPVLHELARDVDTAAPLERIVFQWCAFHLVPLRQFADRELFVVHYEDLLLHRQREVDRVFARLGTEVHESRLAAAFDRLSATADPDVAHQRPQVVRPHADRRTRLAGWRDALTARQIGRARQLLAGCGLDGLYGDDGLPAGLSRLRPGPT